MRTLTALLFIIPYALAQFCGPDELPDKLAVSENGDVTLGCRLNQCPKKINEAGSRVKDAASPNCGKNYYELSCENPLQWVGGIPRGSNVNKIVPLQCCTVQKLRDSPVGEGSKIVEPGQVFEGQIYYDKAGNVMGHDIIKNAQTIMLGEGKYAVSVTVSRFMCQPKRVRAAMLQLQEAAPQGFDTIVEEGAFQGPLGADFGAPAGLQGAGLQGLGPAGDPGLAALAGADPALAAPLGGLGGPGALGGFGNALLGAGPAAAGCFTGETVVETPSGSTTMDQLKIGDKVLAVSSNRIIRFAPVKSFLHRLPDQETEFHRISAGGSSVTLTPLHYIYTTPCDQMAPSMKYAKDVIPGQECLIRIQGESQVATEIQSNEVVRATGIYNPMTEDGTIVADGFMASVHNVFDDTSFMNTLMGSVQNLQKLLIGQTSENHVQIPWALQYVIDYASKLF